jgi:cytochrome P450
LNDEIDSVLQGRIPSFEDLARLRYTEMVFAEALRLYPPAWAIGRKAKENFELAGMTIAGQSICILSPYVVQRDARWFPEPERFDPERWTPDARESRPKLAYFPFGGGARLCIGERFAWMEGVLTIATLAQKWKLKLAANQRVEPLALVTLRTKHGVRMVLEPRG